MSDTTLPHDSADQPDPSVPPATEPTAQPTTEPEPAPLLALREPLPPVVDTEAGLRAVCEAVAAGTGPVAIDAERASGYRYSNRAYLIQLRRGGSGTPLVDPIAFDGLEPLQEAIGDAEWILHAATQDLPCLREEGLAPAALFDTELAGRLLGYPRVGLATLVESLLGQRMKKEHSAVDWSTRPLPTPWLEYAALDVEVLVELRDLLAAELEETGKAEWAKALWELRDSLAEQRDVTPGRILPDSAITVAATHMPTDKGTLMGLKGFHGRGAERYAARWVATLREVAELPEDELPTRAPRSDGPPTPRAWADRDPVAARRLQHAREAMTALAEEHGMPAEQLLTPDYLRRTLWTPPRTREPQALAEAVAEQLRGYGARPWQVELTTPLLVAAILHGDEPVPDPAPED